MATATDLNQWLTFTLSGVPCPGTLPRDGIRGFKRQTGWDEQRGKGTKGATLVLKDAPPCKGTIAMQLIGPGGLYADGTKSTDFAQWDAFADAVLSISAEKQKADGLSICHPSFDAIRLTTVVVEDWSPLRHVGRQLYIVEIALIEWQQPPATSIVSTVSSTAPDQPDTDVPKPVDPRITALEQQIALANQANQNP